MEIVQKVALSVRVCAHVCPAQLLKSIDFPMTKQSGLIESSPS